MNDEHGKLYKRVEQVEDNLRKYIQYEFEQLKKDKCQSHDDWINRIENRQWYIVTGLIVTLFMSVIGIIRLVM